MIKFIISAFRTISNLAIIPSQAFQKLLVLKNSTKFVHALFEIYSISRNSKFDSDLIMTNIKVNVQSYLKDVFPQTNIRIRNRPLRRSSPFPCLAPSSQGLLKQSFHLLIKLNDEYMFDALKHKYRCLTCTFSMFVLQSIYICYSPACTWQCSSRFFNSKSS